MADSPSPETRPTLPNKVVVTLKAGGIFFAIANIICVALVVYAYLTIKMEPKTISVTGSAKKAIVSDLITWSGTISAKDPELIKAYDILKVSADKTKAYLIANGIHESDITFSAITTTRRYHQEVVPAQLGTLGAGSAPTTVITSDKVEMYTLSQNVAISSTDMKRVPEVARTITSLIKDGVEIDSGATNYLYTKLSELKIDMLGEATKDATMRAQQIVNNANGRLGRLVEARMGVMQINPKGSSATSGEGINDTTSYEKEITAIVAAKYEVR